MSHDDTLARLDALPLGTPVRIPSSVEARTNTWVKTAPDVWAIVAASPTATAWCHTDAIPDTVQIPDVVWPEEPLPTEPGTVIVATVEGDRMHLMRMADPGVNHRRLWLTSQPLGIDGGLSWHVSVEDADITDWRVVYRPEAGGTDGQ